MFFVMCSVMFFECMLLRLGGVEAALAAGLLSFVFTAVTAAIYYNRKNLVVYVCIAAVIIVIQFLFSVMKADLPDFAYTALTKLLSGAELDTPEKIFICAGASLLLSILFFIFTKIKPVRYALSAAAVVILIICGTNNIAPNAAEVFAGTGLIICALAEAGISLSYKKETEDNINRIISFLMPAVLVLSVGMAVIPTTEKPIRWEAIRKFAGGVKSAVETIASDISYALSPDEYEFDIGMQGYVERGNEFGGTLIQSNGRELAVAAHDLPSSSIYLIGTVNDVYDGSAWYKSEYPTFKKNDFSLDYIETANAIELSGLTDEEIATFTKKTKFTVKYDDIATKTLFYPLKTFSISSYGNIGAYDTRTPSITFEKPKTRGTEYYISFLEIDYRSPAFIEIARNGTGYESSTAESRAMRENDFNALSDRAEYIKDVYTRLPDNITERTRELADEITSGYQTDYDKLTAIEEYLKGYSYTLNPEKVPNGKEPVDYFLFENKTGYCTYFASAMVVLARCENIPTRYVKGFTVDYANESSPMCYNVLTRDAHAWAEAYIEGVGWIPFEPTAFGAYRFEYHERETAGNGFSERIPTFTQTPTDEELEPEEEQKSGISAFYILVIVCSAISIAVIITGYILIRLRIFDNRYKKSSDTEKFLTCYRMIIRICEKKRLEKKSGETADAYARKVSERFGNDEVSFCGITKAFDRIRYGGGEASASERTEAEKYLTFLSDKLRQGTGKAEALITYIGLRLQ